MSARMPADTASGALAQMPVSSRNTSSAAQFGASAQPIVQTMNRANMTTVRLRRPICSLSGAHTSGPRM